MTTHNEEVARLGVVEVVEAVKAGLEDLRSLLQTTVERRGRVSRGHRLVQLHSWTPEAHTAERAAFTVVLGLWASLGYTDDELAEETTTRALARASAWYRLSQWPNEAVRVAVRDAVPVARNYALGRGLKDEELMAAKEAVLAACPQAAEVAERRQAEKEERMNMDRSEWVESQAIAWLEAPLFLPDPTPWAWSSVFSSLRRALDGVFFRGYIPESVVRHPDFKVFITLAGGDGRKAGTQWASAWIEALDTLSDDLAEGVDRAERWAEALREEEDRRSRETGEAPY